MNKTSTTTFLNLKDLSANNKLKVPVKRRSSNAINSKLPPHFYSFNQEESVLDPDGFVELTDSVIHKETPIVD